MIGSNLGLEGADYTHVWDGGSSGKVVDKLFWVIEMLPHLGQL